MKFLIPILFALAMFTGHSIAGETAQTATFEAWWDWDSATGDWFGARTKLHDSGVEFTGTYYGEVWGNPIGGQRQAAVYDGLLEFGATLDLEKLVGWHGATFQTTWAWFSGQDISGEYIGNLLTVSGIYGYPTIRNYEMWIEQKLLDDKVAIRVGQLGADSEFSISTTAATFINSTFGWGPFLFLNLPNGGPGLPMGTPGVRLQIEAADWLLYRGAIFQGNVFEQNVNRYGFDWALNSVDGFFSMHELAFSWQQAKLPGELKLGGWFQTGRYANPLAAETSSGNYGFYAIADQQLFFEPVSGKDSPTQGLSWFGRVAFGPENTNFNNFYFDTGLVYTGLIPTRNSDQVGVALAYTQLSSGAQNQIAESGNTPIGNEMVLEATYTAQITPWCAIQPDLQFIINPGGTQNIPDALVIGCRTTISF